MEVIFLLLSSSVMAMVLGYLEGVPEGKLLPLLSLFEQPLAMSIPRVWGRGKVQIKCKLVGLKQRIMPSAQPTVIIASPTLRQLAVEVCNGNKKRI